MFIKKFKENKMLAIVLTLTLCATAIMGGVAVYAQNQTEKEVIQDIKQDTIIIPQAWENQLYKEYEYTDPEIAKQVCAKYNLDYDTVTMSSITGEVSNYAFALELKKDCKENPLYHEDGMMGGESLEADIDDIFAFQGARAIIDEVCSTAGIDAAKATIDDLSIEQLMEIQEKAYNTSPHSEEIESEE